MVKLLLGFYTRYSTIQIMCLTGNEKFSSRHRCLLFFTYFHISYFLILLMQIFVSVTFTFVVISYFTSKLSFIPMFVIFSTANKLVASCGIHHFDTFLHFFLSILSLLPLNGSLNNTQQFGVNSFL